MLSRGFARYACAVLFLCGAAVLSGCSPPPNRPKAVVIGIDSADWKLIDALVAEGRTSPVWREPCCSKIKVLMNNER